jgi:hypothetical protein
MTPADMGRVFSFLIANREALSDPMPYRNRRQGEAEVVKILADALAQNALSDFDEFLGAQGFKLKFYDGTDFGVTVKGRIPMYFILARFDSEFNDYLDRNWLIEQIAKGQSEPQTISTVWAVQLWLHLQSYFYTHINRLPSEVSRFNEAFVSAKTLSGAVHDTIEKLRTQGRPQGDNATVWDILTSADKSEIDRRTRKFVRAMKDSGQIIETTEEGEYMQTLLAAVEMALNAERGLLYLLPSGEVTPAPIDVVQVINGYVQDEE